MAHLIQTQNSLTAWRDVCNHIIQNGDGFNLIVEIENPLAFTSADLNEITDSGVITSNSVNDVINTIFPAKRFSKKGNMTNSEFYDLHERLYERGRTMHSKNKSRWGNYFLRFTKFGGAKNNQLQLIIDAINRNTKSQAATFNMHTSSIDYDSNIKMRGNPCLQYVQFGEYDDKLNLTAVYRNHDFLEKALGNYIGLSKLLEFVCSETNYQIGKLTCHSIHYYLKQKIKVRDCIANLTW